MITGKALSKHLVVPPFLLTVQWFHPGLGCFSSRFGLWVQIGAVLLVGSETGGRAH